MEKENKNTEAKVNSIKESVMTLTDTNNDEILRFSDNGDIFVKGKLIENDKEVVQGFRDFLISLGFLNKS